jgi:hypothetical protein
MVGGQRLMGPYQLQSGDAFTLGDNVTLVFDVVTYDPDATIASPRMAVEQPIPTSQSMPPIQAQELPVTPPPPVYAAPVMSQPPVQPQPQPSYSGQVPVSAPVPPKKKKGFPVWLIILLVVILLIVCVCAGSIWFIDANNMWCRVLPFIPGCP